MTIEQEIRNQAAALGLLSCGFARADAVPDAGDGLRAWLGEGRHGEMRWMEDRAEQRASPNGLWPAAKSVIALAMSYAPATDPLALADHKELGRISVYAQGGDYHKTVKKALKALGRWLAEAHGGELKVFVDTAPVMEKPLAAAAGLGWQGKHTICLAANMAIGCSSGYHDEPGASADARQASIGKLHAMHRRLPDGGDHRAGRIDARPASLI